MSRARWHRRRGPGATLLTLDALAQHRVTPTPPAGIMRVMAYLRPPLLTRKVFNAIAMRFGFSGVQTLAVRGRETGIEQTIPVIPVDHDGAPHLVSPRGETEWVRNLRAARGEVELRSKQGSQRYRAAEVPVAERDAIIEAYRAKAGRTVAAYWKKLPDPADHPTFRLTPR